MTRAITLDENGIPCCPFCDNGSVKPERAGAGRYICTVCSRVFIVPSTAKE